MPFFFIPLLNCVGAFSANIVVEFQSPFAAMFKSCSVTKPKPPFDSELFTSELTSAAIDSLLSIHRTPAVTPRRVDWKIIRGLVASNPRLSSSDLLHLDQIHEWCHEGSSEVEGVMIGWTKYPAKTYDHFRTEFFGFYHVFDVHRMDRIHLEMMRTVLFMAAAQCHHKIDHNIFYIDHPREFMMPIIDNDRCKVFTSAENSSSLYPSHPSLNDVPRHLRAIVLPACNRTASHPTFVCVSDRSEDLFFLLAELCVFPRSIAERIRYFRNPMTPKPSQVVSDYIRSWMNMETSRTSWRSPHWKIVTDNTFAYVDSVVEILSVCLAVCEEKYSGRGECAHRLKHSSRHIS
jgi:hypothetical protein